MITDNTTTEIIDTSFPDEVYANLPDFLKCSCDLFKNNIEREIFLVGAFGVLSGCLPNIIGTYDTRKVGCNLFIFVLSQAGAGKGFLIYSKYLVQTIHTNKRQQSKDAYAEYQTILDGYNYNKKKNKGITPEPPPETPKQEMLFIPANSSSSAFLEALSNNDEKGIMFCTEADTLNGTLKQDWGNYSDSLRCAFHHEPIAQLRKANSEFIEISRPFLSVVLSGTPGQLKKLIPSAENGLFSRFCYYEIKLNLDWKNIFAENELDYERIFLRKSEKISSLYERLRDLTEPILFRFTTDQQQLFNQTFERWQRELAGIYGNYIVPSIRRLGLIYFRVAMLLSALRLIDVPDLPLEIVCNSVDYYTAGLITETFISNAVSIIKNFTCSGEMPLFDNDRKNNLYEALPDEFFRDEAVMIAGKIGVSESTLNRLLSSKQLFNKPSYGKYQKIF